MAVGLFMYLIKCMQQHLKKIIIHPAVSTSSEDELFELCAKHELIVSDYHYNKYGHKSNQFIYASNAHGTTSYSVVPGQDIVL